MVDILYESLVGIQYGLLTGFTPALGVGLIASGMGLSSGRRLPILGGALVVALAAVVTGVSIGIFDPTVERSATTRLGFAVTAAGLLGVVATSQGNQIATDLPRDRSGPIVRGKTLSADAIDAIDAAGQVTISSTGAIREYEGYPPLSRPLRTALEDGAWRFPADLQRSELARRLERRLTTEHGLARVDVSLDGRGRATITAAPPEKGVARTLSPGVRAVTVTGLLPTGIEPGDRVTIDTNEVTVVADVLAVESEAYIDNGAGAIGDHDVDGAAPVASRPTTVGFDGGVGRLTVAVEPADAGRLLEATCYRIAVLPNGDNHEYVAAALLEEAGRPVTMSEIPDDGSIDSARLLGTCHDGEWQFAIDNEPDGDPDQMFVAAPTGEVTE